MSSKLDMARTQSHWPMCAGQHPLVHRTHAHSPPIPSLPSPPPPFLYVVQVRAKGAPLVKATLEIYDTIRAQLLPTPAKSHYTYNMRDLSKVFQGMQVSGGEGGGQGCCKGAGGKGEGRRGETFRAHNIRMTSWGGASRLPASRGHAACSPPFSAPIPRGGFLRLRLPHLIPPPHIHAHILPAGVWLQAVGVPVADARSVTRLWAHEALRVFHDRLVSDEDRNWCGNWGRQDVPPVAHGRRGGLADGRPGWGAKRMAYLAGWRQAAGCFPHCM